MVHDVSWFYSYDMLFTQWCTEKCQTRNLQSGNMCSISLSQLRLFTICHTFPMFLQIHLEFLDLIHGSSRQSIAFFYSPYNLTLVTQTPLGHFISLYLVCAIKYLPFCVFAPFGQPASTLESFASCWSPSKFLHYLYYLHIGTSRWENEVGCIRFT